MMKKKRETVSVEELLTANTIEIDALVQLLVDKGIVTKAEVLDAIRTMKARMVRINPSGQA